MFIIYLFTRVDVDDENIFFVLVQCTDWKSCLGYLCSLEYILLTYSLLHYILF